MLCCQTVPSSRAHHSERCIQEGTCHFSQYLSQPAARHLSQGHPSYLPDMNCHLFLITQPLHSILFFYLLCSSLQLGSKQMGLLISLLWAVTEDNEFCTLGEKLKNYFSTTPILASDGESARNFQLVSKGAASSACTQLKAIIAEPKSSLF